MAEKKRGILYLLLSAGVSLFLIWFLLKGLDFGELKEALRKTYWPALLLYAVIAFAGTLVRAWRFGLLIGAGRVRFGALVLVTLVRNCVVDILPGRLASLASYIYILSKRFGIPFEVGASSYLVAFAFDLVSLSPLLVLACLLVSVEALSLTAVVGFSLLLLLVSGAVALYLDGLIRLALRLLAPLLRAVGLREKRPVSASLEKLEGVAGEVAKIRARGVLGRVFLSSFAVRLLKYGSLYFIAYAFLRGFGHSLQSLSFWKLLLGICGGEFTSVLPIPSLAGFGIWEGGMVGILTRLLSFPKDQATLAAFGIHLTSQLYEYVLGILAIAILALPLVRKGRPAARTE